MAHWSGVGREEYVGIAQAESLDGHSTLGLPAIADVWVMTGLFVGREGNGRGRGRLASR